jgi:WD40 repeat protein
VDPQTGATLRSFGNPKLKFTGAIELQNGDILAWTAAQLFVFDFESGAVKQIIGEVPDKKLTRKNQIKSVQEMLDGVVLRTTRNQMQVIALESKTILAKRDAADQSKTAEGIGSPQILSNGQIIFVDERMQIWDVQQNEIKQHFEHTNRMFGVPFTLGLEIRVLPDDSILTTSLGAAGPGMPKSPATVNLWRPDSPTPTHRFEFGKATKIIVTPLSNTRLVLIPQTLFEGNFAALILDTQTGERTPLSWETDSITGSQQLPNGQQLSRRKSGQLWTWDPTTGHTIHQLKGHKAAITGVELLPNNQLLTSSADKSLRIWSLKTGEPIHIMEAHRGRVIGVRILPDGHILSWSKKGELFKWDSQTGERVLRYRGHAKEDINGAAVHKDGRLFSWSDDGTVKVWNLKSGKLLHSINTIADDGPKAVQGVFELKKGRALFWTQHGNVLSSSTFNLWDGRSETAPAIKNQPEDLFINAWQSPTGALIVWNQNGSGEQINPESGEPLFEFLGHKKKIRGQKMLENGDILTWSDDSTMRTWDPKTGTPKLIFKGHETGVLDTKILASGELLSVDESAVIRTWDLNNAQPIATFSGHQGQITSANLLPNGRLLTAAKDGTHRYWDSATGEQIAMVVHNSKGDWSVVSPDGRFDGSTKTDLLHWVCDGQAVLQLDQLFNRYYQSDLLKTTTGTTQDFRKDQLPFMQCELPPVVQVAASEKGSSEVRAVIKDSGHGIGELRVWINDIMMEIETSKHAKACKTTEATAGTQNLCLDLSEHPQFDASGDNAIRITAMSAGPNAVESRGASGNSKPQPPPPISEQDREKPQLFAVIVGVSKFAGAGLKLDYAAKDARDFANALSLATADKKLFRKTTITLLTSDSTGDSNAGRQDIAAAMAALKPAQKDDVVLIFLAGHARTQELSATKSRYLFLTQEAKDGTSILEETEQKTATITEDDILDWLTNSGARKRVIILDTCQSGAGATAIAGRGSEGDAVKALKRLKIASGLHILAGSAPSKDAFEHERYQQGLLTYALLEGMKGPALEDDELFISELFSYAAQRVQDLAEEIGEEQIPQVESQENNFQIGYLNAQAQKSIQLAQPMTKILRPTIDWKDGRGDKLRLGNRLISAIKNAKSLHYMPEADEAEACSIELEYQGTEENLTAELWLGWDLKDLFEESLAGSIDEVTTAAVAAINIHCSPPN